MSVAVATPPSAYGGPSEDVLPARSDQRRSTGDDAFLTRRGWWIAGILAACGVAAVGIWDAVKYDFIAKRFGVVEPDGLYRSGQISEAMFTPTIREHEIDTVVCLMGNDREDPGHVAEVAAVEAMPGVKFERFPLRGDGTGDYEVYYNALASLVRARRAGRKVLVHCAAGSQRTGSIIAAYRLLVRRDDCAEVYADLGRYGWEPDDAAMLDYLNQHLPESARRLYEAGLISEIPDPMPVLGP
ncbi:dual specificity protein phosphatase family protein [Alienimonas chondri]|nr:dual specificity protein phosphatase family protein [Alienimonas chondri]